MNAQRSSVQRERKPRFTRFSLRVGDKAVSAGSFLSKTRRIHKEFTVDESPKITVERPGLPIARSVNAKLPLFEFVRPTLKSS
jgi:hypothetical protein